MGLGIMPQGSGFSAAKFFAEQGAQVLVTDMKTRAQLKDNVNKLKKYKNLKFVLGKHRKQDFKEADLLVRNPGIKPNSVYLKIARKNKIPITNDVGLFLDYLDNKAKVIGVTGTRGKSTTTTLIYEILKKKYKQKVWLGGNIGKSPLNFVKKIKKNDIVVLEVSSFQLYDLKKPHFDVAVLTNFYPDHLDFYKNLSDYWKDKKNIVSGQNKSDFLVLNRTERKLKTKGKIILFGKSKFKEHKLVGEHNQYNIDAAWKVAKIFKVSDKIIKEVVSKFRGVENRLEFIKETNGVRIYNDTTATHPKATVVALNSFPKNKVILISGGNSKNLPLNEMVKTINDRVKHLILIPGNANKDLPQGIKVKNIKQAVTTAWKLAQPGDIILFSPGLTWLPRINEFKRGEQFLTVLQELI